MSTVAPVAMAPAGATPRPLRRRRGRVTTWLCGSWLVVVVLGAVLAPWLPLDDPDATDFSVLRNNAPPGTAGHLLGTDQNGFDVLSRLVWGGRVSLVVAVGVLALGMTVGGAIGMVAGYGRGRVEALLMGLTDVLLAFPSLILLIAVVAFLGADLPNVVLGISLVSIPAFARIARASTLSFASREFVLAARAAGATHRRVMVREILPNVALPLFAFGLLVVAIAIVAEGSLAFLGLTAPDTISWGGMINGGRRALQQEDVAHTSLLPAVAMFLTVLSINLLGDRLRAGFDVREPTP